MSYLPVSSTTKNALLDSYFGFIESMEGNVPFYYLDSQNLPTIGAGFHIANTHQARGLPLYVWEGEDHLETKGTTNVEWGLSFNGAPQKDPMPKGRVATDEEKETTYAFIEYVAAHHLVPSPGSRRSTIKLGTQHFYHGVEAESFCANTSYKMLPKLLYMLQSDILNYYKMVEMTRVLRAAEHHFPDFWSFPEPAQKGIVDMLYNMGTGSLWPHAESLGFPNFVAAIQHKPPQWQIAAENCHRKNISLLRSQRVYNFFKTAYSLQPD